MKYTIMGFYQQRLVELNLDLSDAMIIRWIVDFFNSKKVKAFVDGDQWYFWLDYKHLLNDLPVLNMKKDTLYRRLKKMVESGLLEHHCERTNNGNFSCYRFNQDVYGSLLGSDQSGGDTEKNPYRVRNKIRNMNPSTKESIYNPHNPPQGEACLSEPQQEAKPDPTQEVISQIIGKLNEVAKTNYRPSSKPVQRLLRARLKEYDANTIANMILFKAFKWNGTDMEKYLRPETLFNATKCESYVNEMLQYVKDQEAKKKPVVKDDDDDYWTRTRLAALRGNNGQV